MSIKSGAIKRKRKVKENVSLCNINVFIFLPQKSSKIQLWYFWTQQGVQGVKNAWALGSYPIAIPGLNLFYNSENHTNTGIPAPKWRLLRLFCNADHAECQTEKGLKCLEVITYLQCQTGERVGNIALEAQLLIQASIGVPPPIVRQACAVRGGHFLEHGACHSGEASRLDDISFQCNIGRILEKSTKQEL